METETETCLEPASLRRGHSSLVERSGCGPSPNGRRGRGAEGDVATASSALGVNDEGGAGVIGIANARPATQRRSK